MFTIYSATGCTLSARPAPFRRVECENVRTAGWNETDGNSASPAGERFTHRVGYERRIPLALSCWHGRVRI